MSKMKSTATCALCHELVDADHTKVVLRFNDNGDPELYHKPCAKKKNLGTVSTGRPHKAESEIQGKNVHLKLSQSNKDDLMDKAKQLKKPSLGQLMKEAAAEYMSKRTKEDVPHKTKWSHPGNDSSFMLKLDEKTKDEIVSFLAPSEVHLNTFFYQITLDYANRALKKQI